MLSSYRVFATQLDRHISLIHLAELQPKVLSVGLGIPKPVSFLVVVMKAESSRSKPPLETREEDEEEIHEETATLAAVKEISMQSGCRLHVRRRTKNNSEGFSRWTCFLFTPGELLQEFC